MMSYEGTGDFPSVFFAFNFDKVSGGYVVLEMYIFGGILILTMLIAVFMTRKDSVVDDENGKYRCGKSGNRKRIVRERKSGKVVRID